MGVFIKYIKLEDFVWMIVIGFYFGVKRFILIFGIDVDLGKMMDVLDDL